MKVVAFSLCADVAHNVRVIRDEEYNVRRSAENSPFGDDCIRAITCFSGIKLSGWYHDHSALVSAIPLFEIFVTRRVVGERVLQKRDICLAIEFSHVDHGRLENLSVRAVHREEDVVGAENTRKDEQ